MNKKTELRWLLYCAGFLLLFYLLVALTLPEGAIVNRKSAELEVDTDSIQVHPVYVYVYPAVAILGLNFAFLGLRLLSRTARVVKIISFVLIFITGVVFGTVAIMWGLEFVYHPADAPLAAFILPFLLFLSLAVMAFRRNSEMLEMPQGLEA